VLEQHPIPVDAIFVIATLAFAWGLSLATYRLFAVYNGWPMGEWQAHRPGLPIAIGLFAVLFAMLFAVARGGATVLIVPLFGFLCALAWTAMLRIGAQSALLLAPMAVMALLLMWISAANSSLSSGGAAQRNTVGSVTVPASGPAPGFSSPVSAPPVLPSQFERSPSERPIVLAPAAEPVRGIPTDRQPSLVQPPHPPAPQR
jgi:hypothetical protein